MSTGVPYVFLPVKNFTQREIYAGGGGLLVVFIINAPHLLYVLQIILRQLCTWYRNHDFTRVIKIFVTFNGDNFFKRNKNE